jgi:galactose oxidase-like protein
MKHSQNIARNLLAMTLALAGLIGVTLISSRLTRAQTIEGTWAVTGKLNVSRNGHTATLLPNGKVLAAGGLTNTANGRIIYTTLNSAELYDPTTGKWSYTGNLMQPRELHAATLLQDGQVLVAGGFDVQNNLGSLAYLNSAELFDPATGQWRPTGSFNTITGHPNTVLLADGRVLAVGTSTPGAPSRIYEAELYDPATGTWSSTTAPLTLGPYFASLTRLANGKVLGLGGDFPAVKSAELYDPATRTWSSAGFLNVIQNVGTALLLHNGNVLVTGWTDSSPGAELYDPYTGTWHIAGKPTIAGVATLLADDRVLLTGNYDAYESPPPGSGEEVYDPASGTWSQTSQHSPPRASFTATLLSDGRVLAAGGSDYGYDFGEVIFNNAEVYTPAAGPGPNQIDDTQFFVRQHYRDFLSREPDPEGLAFWTNQITSCGGDQACIEVKRINDSGSFFHSIEFQETGYLAYRTYLAAFGNLTNAPVPITFSEFVPDTQALGRGVIVRQAGWESVLENNKRAFLSAFVQRSRFTSAFPPAMSAREFVDKLNSNAGNPLSQTERDQLVSDLSGGRRSRADVLRAIAENPKLVQAEFNRAFVLMQYFGYLRRNPNDAPDGNFVGYNFWLDKLNSFNGDFIAAEMVKAFITSTEYRRRFGP